MTDKERDDLVDRLLDLGQRIERYPVDHDKWIAAYHLVRRVHGRNLFHVNGGFDENHFRTVKGGSWFESAKLLRPRVDDLEYHIVLTKDRCNASLFLGSEAVAVVDVYGEHVEARADLVLTLRYHADRLAQNIKDDPVCDCHAPSRQLFDYHPPCPVHEVDDD